MTNKQKDLSHQHHPCGDGRPPLNLSPGGGFAFKKAVKQSFICEPEEIVLSSMSQGDVLSSKKKRRDRRRKDESLEDFPRKPKVRKFRSSPKDDIDWDLSFEEDEKVGIHVNQRGRSIGYTDTDKAIHLNGQDLFRSLGFEDGADDFPLDWTLERRFAAKAFFESEGYSPYVDRHQHLASFWQVGDRLQPEVIVRVSTNRTRFSIKAKPVQVEFGYSITAKPSHRVDEPSLDLGTVRVVQIEEEFGHNETISWNFEDSSELIDRLGWPPLLYEDEDLAVVENLVDDLRDQTLRLDEVFC